MAHGGTEVRVGADAQPLSLSTPRRAVQAAHSLEPPLQGTVVFTTQVPALGRYAFLLHSYQPAHPTFPVEVLVNGGRIWQGEWLRTVHV